MLSSFFVCHAKNRRLTPAIRTQLAQIVQALQGEKVGHTSLFPRVGLLHCFVGMIYENRAASLEY